MRIIDLNLRYNMEVFLRNYIGFSQGGEFCPALLFTRSNELSVCLQIFGDCRDNVRNSQRVFLIVYILMIF